MPTSNAILAFDNLLEKGTVVASSENAAYPVANLFDWLPCDFFRPAAGGTINIELTLPVAASADYFAFYNHDLPSVAGTILLQYWTGSAWANCFSAVTPSDNAPRVVSFTSRTSTRWRIVITGTGVFNIACVSFGVQLPLEYGMYLGWTPPKFGRATRLINSVSDGGVFLGRSIISQGVRSSVNVNYASDAWMRTNWLKFVTHAEKKPFFFVPNIVAQPTECVFAFVDGDIPAPAHNAYGFMGVSVPISGMVE
jgi:hypothetical protein